MLSKYNHSNDLVLRTLSATIKLQSISANHGHANEQLKL
jgi:hypothetical protein